MKLSKYPKNNLSYDQIYDEIKLEKWRKRHNIQEVCTNCGNTKFFIDTLGIEHCSKCYYPVL